MTQLFFNVEKSEYYDNMAKFIFIAIDFKDSDMNELFSFFYDFRIPNAVVIGKIMDKNSFKVSRRITYDPFALKLILLDNKLTNTDEVFRDKLIDLSRYKYKVMLYIDPQRIQVTPKSGLIGPDIMFLRTVAKKQNALINMRILKDFTNSKEIATGLTIGSVDICLNTGLVLTASNKRDRKTVNTFDTDGFCAMIPYPEITSYFDFFFKPFDKTIWIWIVLSMICFAIVWRLLNFTSTINANSSCYFIFGFVSSFLGQLIPFREHRPMQKLILQLTIFLTFILSNIYQGLIISSITNSHHRIKLTTIEEMINSDFSYYVDPIFSMQLNGSEYYQRMSPRMKHGKTMNINFKNFSSQNIVIITRCSIIDSYLDDSYQTGRPYDTRAFEFYYKLNEKFNSFYLELPIGSSTFFHKRLNEFSLRVFESGIKQASSVLNPNGNVAYRKPKALDQANDFADLIDIAPAFYLLAFGLTISLFTFLMEIFWNDFIQHLNISEIFKNIFKARRMHPEIIQVRPINPLEENAV